MGTFSGAVRQRMVAASPIVSASPSTGLTTTTLFTNGSSKLSKLKLTLWEVTSAGLATSVTIDLKIIKLDSASTERILHTLRMRTATNLNVEKAQITRDAFAKLYFDGRIEKPVQPLQQVTDSSNIVPERLWPYDGADWFGNTTQADVLPTCPEILIYPSEIVKTDVTVTGIGTTFLFHYHLMEYFSGT